MSESKSCASTNQKWDTWESINWTKCEVEVKKLQARIVKAQKLANITRRKPYNGCWYTRSMPKHWRLDE